MVKRFFVLLLLFTSALGFTGCKSKTDTGVLDRFSRNKLAEVNRSLTQVIISDVFSPPVCSRIYAYCNIAAYEALVPVFDQLHDMCE